MNEIVACISFIENFLNQYGDDYVPFHSCPLKDAISEICFAPVKFRKIIGLYFHNETDAFSQMFCSSLEGLKHALEKSYYIIGWDISNRTYHSALKKVLDDCISFEPAKMMIDQNVAALLIIYPIEDSVTIFSILHGSKIKMKNIAVALREIEQCFEAELKDEIDLEGIQERSQRSLDIGSREFQQLMHDRLSDRIYDCFEYDEHEFLKDKIAFSKYGPPKTENGYDKKQWTAIEDTYNQILKYNNEVTEWRNQIAVSFVYNCLEPLPSEKLKHAKKYPDYNPKTDMTPSPIYIVRKCKGSENPCRIFIDNDNRAYMTWQNYIEDNKLQKCAMVLPEHGHYKNDTSNYVRLERHLSPSCGIGKILLKGTDIATTLVGLASGGILIAAMIPAVVVAPVAIAVATATGIGVGIYSMVRGAATIYDRHTHGENMSFANSGARGAYIDLISGSLGFVGAGAATVVTELASKGIDIGHGAQAAVNAIRMMNVSAAGASFANTTVDVVDDWMNEQEKPSYLTYLQLKSSILFFTNYNFKTAFQELDEDAKAAELDKYQELLEYNQTRKCKNPLEQALVGKDYEVLPILAVRNPVEIFAILQRNSFFLPTKINFTLRDGDIYFNGVLVCLFKFLTKQLIDLPRSKTDGNRELIDLKSFGLEKAFPNNSHFSESVAVLCKGFPENTQKALLQLFNTVIKVVDIELFEICRAFTRRETLTAVFEWLLSFLEFKVNQKELIYVEENISAQQTGIYDEEEFYTERRISKDSEERAEVWFEQCIEQCVIDEVVQYVMSKLAEKIYGYCDNEDKRQRREENTGKNYFRIRCEICGGYYFETKSLL